MPERLLVLVGVLKDEAEAGGADGVFGGSEDPDAGVVHLDQGVDALAGAEEEGLDQRGVGDGVAVEREDLELVAGEREAAVLNGAGVEEVEEDAVTLFDAEGFAGAERLVVDAVGVGVDLEAVGVGVHLRLIGLFGLRVGLTLLVGVFHAGGEEGFPVAQGEEDLLVVGAGIGAFDH